MEPITLLLGLLAIVGTGALTKVGENITDRTGDLSRSLLSLLRRKSPNTQTEKLLAAGQEIDVQQAVIDLEPIANDLQDPEVAKLLAEVRSLLSSNLELTAKVEALRVKIQQSGNHVNIGKQVNVDQSGTGNTQTNTFNL